MLDFDTALNLMRKYGYSSTSVHPYIYKKGDKLGICYSYIDEQYGILERIKFFDNSEIFEEFLKKLSWFKENGKKYNVRIVLDNYEIEDPKLMFLRNDKLMAKGEMFDIDSFDMREAQKKQLDEISRVIYEAGNILVIYDDIKNGQIQYFKEIHDLKNKLRQKYFELQKEVDYYNDVELERELVLLPDEKYSNPNEMMEYGIKDRYNSYKQNHPTLEDAVTLVKECWDLCSILETNDDLHKAHVEENAIRNEFRVVDEKIKLMKELNDMPKTFFKQDIVKKFRKINKQCKETSILIDPNYVKTRSLGIDKKYSYFSALDFNSLADYLREAMEDTSYNDLAIKYAKVNVANIKESIKLPLNEIASNLLVQYQRLSVEEQAILVLYNSNYRKIYDMILDINNFANMSITDILTNLNSVSGFSKIKTECYDLVKVRIDYPDNISLKNKVFKDINFDTFELFIESLVNQLKRLKAINNKMIINSDLITYCYINNLEAFDKKGYVVVTNDLNSVMAKVKSRDERVGVMKLKYSLPVLYAPYKVDFGDLYSKDASYKMELKVVTGFELLIDKDDILLTRDENTTTVVKYFSEPKTIQDVTIVDEIKMNGQTTFCRMSLFNNVSEQTQSQVGQKTETAITSQVESDVTYAQSTVNTTSMVQQVTNNQQNVVLVAEVENAPVMNNTSEQYVAPVVENVNITSQPVVSTENNMNGDANNV